MTTKILVETPDSTQLLGSMGGLDTVAFNRPSVVTKTSFIEAALARGAARLVHPDNLPAGATDASWAEALAEAKAAEGELDLEFTIAAWISTVPEEEAPAAAAAPTTAGSDAAQTAPVEGNEKARNQKKIHQAPAEG